MWGVTNPLFHNGSAIIGKEFADYFDLPKMYLGIAGLQSAYRYICRTMQKNTITEKTEIQEDRKRV